MADMVQGEPSFADVDESIANIAIPERDSSRLDLPPGSGLLGFPKAASNVLRTQQGQMEDRGESPKYRTPVHPPPTQRRSPLPCGVRLTRIDCDDCFTPWPEHEDHSQITKQGGECHFELHKSMAKSELERLRQQEHGATPATRPEEGGADPDLLALGMPVAFGKGLDWDGKEVITHWEKDFSATTNPTMNASSPLLDYGEPEEQETDPSRTLDQLRRLRQRVSSNFMSM
jgi:hypothetical protein